MTKPRTILEATPYWEQFYGDFFRFGQGTEHILELLCTIPPIDRWTDMGSGSESLLWASGLSAAQVTAVDLDPARLALLTETAHTGQPRGTHMVALALCGRTNPDSFTQRCRSLAATVTADCLHPRLLPPEVLGADLITQFGLLGLCSVTTQFTDAFARLHRGLPEGGWDAGANWVAHDPTGRVPLTRDLYRHAAAYAGLRLLRLHRFPSTDPQFPFVWTYLARRNR